MKKRKYPKIVYFAESAIGSFGDPIKFFKAFPKFFKYFKDMIVYSRMEGSEKINWLDLVPSFGDSKAIPVDSHYFYQAAWLFKKILKSQPKEHYDCGAMSDLAATLSTITKLNYIELRPIDVNLENFNSIHGDLLKLPFKDNSIKSFSCLHTLEHVGLGRYGDALNPLGTKEACQELKRVLAPGGNLYISVPVGKPRICFNSQRTHHPNTIREYFSGLKLMEFSGVDGNGNFKENRSLEELENERQGCGFYWFKKI